MLCFIATKKLWTKMLLCEQLKKYYAHEDIPKAYNIAIELSDARRARLTTRDTKRRINVTVQTMLDDLVDNRNIIFATARRPHLSTSKEFQCFPQRFFTKTKSEATPTHTLVVDPTSGDLLNVFYVKGDVLMEKFMNR